MRNKLSLLGVVFLTGCLVTGCAGPEKKLGRGMNNLFEIVRLGEMRRTMEQTALFDSPDVAYGTGTVRGLHRSLRRTFVGAYEIVTFPIPNHGIEAGRGDYGPVFMPENPVYPDSYKPLLIADDTFATDAALGFAGGDIAPMIPGSRFHVFDN